MKANDSHECRNCHSWEAMDWHAQSLVAQREQVGEVEGFHDPKLVPIIQGCKIIFPITARDSSNS